ncbi:uncharacterized protein LOC9630270 [Selaginella moellendorffii]|uniref:uncharacterized protein LOC9630270 n=1 Tax=Selaginella moellendorffii TaxID=88036 RepID=UPI000D1C26B1|nr:uncharacterized protein LOC9630270 [Selaginella moellendorffii]|eukprot:XP_024517267.1 uncharacterized protein LOC9630270 [Selaginella moellendorffii]
MPVDLPGFYFDIERNRYFPISRKPEEAPAPAATPEAGKKKVIPIPKLLLDREIFPRNPVFFRRSTVETFSVRPQTWRYGVITPQCAVGWGYCGYFENNAVFMGSSQGAAFVVSETHCRRPNDRFSMIIHPLPKNESLLEPGRRPPSLAVNRSLCAGGSSMVTAIKTLSTKQNPHKIAIVARLGNATGGSLQVLDLDTLAVTADVRINYTVWTADMFPCGTKASIGTHTRAGVVNLQTGQRSWIYHCPHDVLSQKTDSTGNIVVCGFRNGCILSLDIRERRFWKMDSRNSIRMKSSVCSLLLLPSDESYVVASDMSDSIRLWDRRLVGRGWLRSFEGHKNSFSSLQLGIDPTGTVLMSGCEDNAVRIWSLRTGSLLHTETGISCTPAKLVFRESDDDELWSTWLASRDELVYMHASSL